MGEPERPVREHRIMNIGLGDICLFVIAVCVVVALFEGWPAF